MDADQITVVAVQEMETTARKYTAVRLLIRGDWYSRDVTSDRDIRQAHALAMSHGAEWRVARSRADLVAAALDSQARHIKALTQNLTEARAEIVECDALRADMASILRAVAIAVRGPEVDGISWGWSDLPGRVTAAVNMMSGAVELAREHAATIEALTAERDKREAEFMAMLAAEHQVSAVTATSSPTASSRDRSLRV